MYCLVLLDDFGSPFRTIGPFADEFSPAKWLNEQGIFCDFKVFEFETHGWDE